MIVLALALTVTGATAQPVVRVLRYAPPADTYRAAASGAVDDYTFNGFNASVQVYQFRPFSGDIRQAFQATLLRDWITVTHQEENLAGPPTFAPFNVPGAQYAVIANFAEAAEEAGSDRRFVLTVRSRRFALVETQSPAPKSASLAQRRHRAASEPATVPGPASLRIRTGTRTSIVLCIIQLSRRCGSLRATLEPARRYTSAATAALSARAISSVHCPSSIWSLESWPAAQGRVP